MQQNQAIIAELKMEATNTRKMLERVPIDKTSWRPHHKSMTLGRLATHVAEIPEWVIRTMGADELDFATAKFDSHTATSNKELLSILDTTVNKAIEILERSTDDDFNKLWTMRNGEEVYFTLPKKVVLRTFALSHNYHHRAQLGLYLRMLDVPVPGMYGPTADEI